MVIIHLAPEVANGQRITRSAAYEIDINNYWHRQMGRLAPALTLRSRSHLARAMLPKDYTRVVFAQRPVTHITSTTFRKETITWDLKPGPSEVLVRVDWISLDPVMRTWLTDAGSYGGTVQIGEVMRSIGLLGTIVEIGEGSRLRPGDVVSSHRGLGKFYSILASFPSLSLRTGWTEYGVVKEEDVQVIQ
jgi:NADPH-dependent curcumin reductase CurA